MNSAELTTEMQAGQRLMVGFEGQRFNDQLRFLIGDLHVGGLILFAANVDHPAQIERLCQRAQAYARHCGLPPLFVAIDQEGGAVARLRPPFTQFPGNPHIRDIGAAERFGATTARELKAVGINMDYAPVLDTAFDPETSIMAQRAFGHDPKRVAELGLAVIDALQKRRVMAVAKHFPGIGRTTLDSHQDRPELGIATEVLSARDILPFKAAMDHGVSGMMLAHILYSRIDARWPASLSPTIVKDLLREELGYAGLVMTDDLDMGAVIKNYDIATVIKQITAAEIDLALICHWSDNIPAAHGEIYRGLVRDPQRQAAGERCVERILAAKAQYLGGPSV